MESESWPNKLPMIKTERKEDMRAEKEINKFLSDFFYGRISPFFETIIDLDGQIRGIDTKMEYNGQIIRVDEKCQLNFLNQNVSTQCLELGSYTSNRVYRNGWFIREGNDTEYYLFTWIPKCSVQYKDQLTCDSIEVMDAILVSKEKLQKHLKDNFGIDKNTLHERVVVALSGYRDDQSVRISPKDGKTRRINKIYFTNEQGQWILKRAHITMSISLNEKPTNLVVYLSEYAKIYEDRFIITRDSIKSMKGNKLIWPIQKI